MLSKKNLQPYLIVFFALLVLVSFPRKVQNLMRHQFFRPFIPLASFKPPPKYEPILQKELVNEPAYHALRTDSNVAQIIYRNPTHWNSSFWINLGSNNASIALHSPVLYQNIVIGIVDYVGKKQSRVKLVTNSGLTVSVRALRGKNQYYDLLNHLNALASYPCVQNQGQLFSLLQEFKDHITSSDQTLYLAKGELFGQSQPLWRGSGRILIGRGFNCSTADDLSLSRDLLSGIPNRNSKESVEIIETNDLLITTGLDGTFPAGLAVAKVLSVDPLEEGAYFYTIKASSLVSNLDNLSYVEVIRPLNFEGEKTTNYSGL